MKFIILQLIIKQKCIDFSNVNSQTEFIKQSNNSILHLITNLIYLYRYFVCPSINFIISFFIHSYQLLSSQMMKESSVSSLDTSRSTSYTKQSFEKNINNARCIKGHLSTTLCISKSCNKNAFICNQNSCPCFAVHKNCFKIPIKEFTEKLQSKILNVDEQINFHDKKVDQFIDNIIDQASKIKETFKIYAQQKFKYCLLSQNEQKMLKSLKQNNVKDIKGAHCIQLIIEMDSLITKPIQNIVAKQIQKLSLQWKKVQNVCKKKLQVIKQQLKNQFFQFKQNHFKQSQIVKEQKQKVNILKFFDKKIKNFKLLYKASQNAFDTNNFFTNTKGVINKLILIETQFGKKIGGFTPLSWRKVQTSQVIADFSNSSFTFSLSNNQKFIQKDLNSGIKNEKGYGPRFFGTGSSDIAIQNKANNILSCSYLNQSYINQKYSQSNKQRYKQFIGNPKNESFFKTKQWQAWQVIFQ